MSSSIVEINISIHALREEGDAFRVSLHRPMMDFYPRPPRGGRPPQRRQRQAWIIFLSTPSARRATLIGTGLGDTNYISIHALREEGDDI